MTGVQTCALPISSRSAVGYSSAQTLGSAVFAIKNAAGADVSGTSANISEMLNLINNPSGFYHSDNAYIGTNLVLNAGNVSSYVNNGTLTVAGGIGVAKNTYIGGNTDICGNLVVRNHWNSTGIVLYDTTANHDPSYLMRFLVDDNQFINLNQVNYIFFAYLNLN